jgi:hypothetical protein
MEQYKQILSEILDILEGGDVSLDFEHMPTAATSIRIIADIAKNALSGIEEIQKVHEMLEGLE